MPHEGTLERMSEAAIRRQLLSHALQRPSTLLPLAIAAGLAIYLLLLSPLFGGGRWATVALAGSGGVALASMNGMRPREQVGLVEGGTNL